MFDISGLVKIDENVDKCKCQIKTKDFVQELAPGITSRKKSKMLTWYGTPPYCNVLPFKINKEIKYMYTGNFFNYISPSIVT